MPNCKSFLVTEAERKHVRWRARFQQHVDASCLEVFPPPPSCKQGGKGNSHHSDINIRGTCTVVCHRQTLGDFSTCDALRPGLPKTVTTPEIIEPIYELILEDRRISAKSITEQLGISRKRVGVHHSWRFGHVEALREVGPEMPEQGSKPSKVPLVWANFGIFSARSKWFPVAIVDHGRNLVISL